MNARLLMTAALIVVLSGCSGENPAAAPYAAPSLSEPTLSQPTPSEPAPSEPEPSERPPSRSESGRPTPTGTRGEDRSGATESPGRDSTRTRDPAATVTPEERDSGENRTSPTPITASPAPWRTPTVNNNQASVRLDHRYPTNVCRIYSAPEPGTTVRIDALTAASGPYTPAEDPTDGGAIPAGTERARMGVTGRPCLPGSQSGDEVPGDVACAPGSEITDRSGCGLFPEYEAPTPLGTYQVNLTWKLSTLCRDTRFAPCQGLGVTPTADRPVRASWSVTGNYCVRVDSARPAMYNTVGCAVE
ncbi:hypothetical protein [Nonomuraea lactucae]|uniref:hypothetical protein n=1 Tax=Nonomuraea lactucae TaxID=2249762 RepID=UPI0013B3699F|nr:hypothetical protein [Nonomuraea lactucae]